MNPKSTASRRTFAAIQANKFLVTQANSSTGWSTIVAAGGNASDTVATNTTTYRSGGACVQLNKVHVTNTQSIFGFTLPKAIDIAEFIENGKISVWFRSNLTAGKISSSGFDIVFVEDISAQKIYSIRMPLPDGYQEDKWYKIVVDASDLDGATGETVDLRNIIAVGVGFSTQANGDVGYILLNDLELISTTKQDQIDDGFATYVESSTALIGAAMLVPDGRHTKIHKLTVTNMDLGAAGYVQVFFSVSPVLGTTPADLIFPIAAGAAETFDINFKTGTGMYVAVTTTATGNTAMGTAPKAAATVS